MYIDNFINKKYIALLCYCINLNNDNCVIVDLKYVKKNKIMLLRKLDKSLNSKALKLRDLLTKLRKSNIDFLIFKIKLYWYKIQLRKKLKAFLKYLKTRKFNQKDFNLSKKNYIKNLNKKLKIFKSKKNRILNKKHRSYELLNMSTNLHKFFNKKNKLIKFILHKLLHNQVFANAKLFDVFLKLNLHPLFLKRFKHHFLIFFKQLNKKYKKKFNFNNFNLYYSYRVFPKIIKFGNFLYSLGKIRKCSTFFNSLYENAENRLARKITFDIDLKYFKKFKNYIFNLRNINYITLSFKLNVFINKKKKTIRRYLRKFKRINFFNFFNLAFLKLVIFLFLYWFNNLIILFNIKIKGNILSGWFKSIGFMFKTYIWRKRVRHYYLKYDSINKYIFLNYKNRLLKI